jgi:hypothetical protein
MPKEIVDRALNDLTDYQHGFRVIIPQKRSATGGQERNYYPTREMAEIEARLYGVKVVPVRASTRARAHGRRQFGVYYHDENGHSVPSISMGGRFNLNGALATARAKLESGALSVEIREV